ncbi:MAG: BatA domain-containing protein, partial [Bacteroidia bacterium]
MTFLYPAFLYALALTAIPVIIHIFNFRRFKKQEFTQVKFLEKATKVRKRFRQLKDLIIMLLRMLAIACLVIAFAHPLPKNAADTKGKQNLISIYIDNSFSMGLQGENGELLAVAKKKIEEITEAFGENTLYQLVNNNTAERSRTFVEKDILLDAVQQVDLKPFILTDNELNQLQRSDLMQG